MAETCRRCGEEKDDVEERYSYGIYAGQMCGKCAFDAYNDHCGLHEIENEDGTFSYVEEDEQGAVEDLDEFAYGGYDAIYGEDE